RLCGWVPGSGIVPRTQVFFAGMANGAIPKLGFYLLRPLLVRAADAREVTVLAVVVRRSLREATVVRHGSEAPEEIGDLVPVAMRIVREALAGAAGAREEVAGRVH